jgi:hypothetical protein
MAVPGRVIVSGLLVYHSNILQSFGMRALFDDQVGGVDCYIPFEDYAAEGTLPGLSIPRNKYCTVGMSEGNTPLTQGKHLVQIQFSIPDKDRPQFGGIMQFDSSGRGQGFTNLQILSY